MKSQVKVCAVVLFLFYVVSIGIAGINDNMIAYWSFDEGEGTLAYDSSGLGNTGEILGASWVEGISGNALSFDGLNDYVRVADQACQQITTNQLSISMWFNLGSDVGATQARLICKQEYDNNGNTWSLEFFGEGYGLNTGNQLVFHDSDGSSNVQCWSNVFIEAGGWHHISVTDDSGLIKMYLDGELIRTKPGGLGIPEYIPADIMIGRTCYNPWGATFYYHGLIDEVRLYNRALDATEVEELASIPEPGTLVILGLGAIILRKYRR